jgi:hypothetical protein
VVMASGGSGLEDISFSGQVALRSNGRQPAEGAVLDIVLHSAGALRSAGIHGAMICALIDDHHARCTLPAVPRNAQLFVDYTAVFADPGNYDITFTVSAPGDTAPANDTLTRAIIVRPFNDIGVSGELDMGDLYAGQTRTKTFSVTTDRRALASARFAAGHAPPALTVESISAMSGGAPFGDCRVDVASGGVCDFLDLPAFAHITVTVTYRAAEGTSTGHLAVYVSTAGDVVNSNNAQSAHVHTHGMTDLELRVAPTLSGPKTSTLAFPLISVMNGAEKAFGARLEVTLPAEITLVSVSASSAICSGNRVVTCDFSELDPLATATVALTVRATVTGNFLSSLKLTASNDNNVANDSGEVSVQIAGGDPAAVSDNKKSGGGSLEWLGLMLLGALVWRRMAALRLARIPVQVRAARKIPGGPTR